MTRIAKPPCQRPPITFRPAFTVIELLIVISIIAVLLSLTLILSQGFVEAQAFRFTRTQIASTVAAARTRAMSDQRVTGVLFYMEDGRPTEVELFQALGRFATISEFPTRLDYVPRQVLSSRVAIRSVGRQESDRSDTQGGFVSPVPDRSFFSMEFNSRGELTSSSGTRTVDRTGEGKFVQGSGPLFPRRLSFLEGVPRATGLVIAPISPLQEFRAQFEANGGVWNWDRHEEWFRTVWQPENPAAIMVFNRYTGTLLRNPN